MKPYEWMVTYTPQTDWIKGGGVIVWLSFFTGIFGSGAYLASLYFNNLTGMVISWLIITVLKGGLHVGHAKKPFRLWRMVLKVRTSWIARGTVFTALLALVGAVQIILSYRMPGTTWETLFKVLAGIAAFAILIYEGFTINYITGIPFWNSALLPVTLICWGVLNGLALIAAVGAGEGYIAAVAMGSRIALVVTIILIVLYLWNAIYAGATARESVREITQGGLGFIFWVGVFLIGILIPLFISFGGSLQVSSQAILLLVCEIIGTLAFTYGVFKAGGYGSLVSA